jgi:sn-glycerol 3-phosphate transport system ATP-binding protein
MIVRVPGTTAPASGEKVTAIAAREKLHVFSSDGRRRLSA